jgi:hypothetical protein
MPSQNVNNENILKPFKIPESPNESLNKKNM